MLDHHPYLSFLYLLGCGLVVALMLVNIVLHWTLGWLTKANTIAANLRKLEPPVKTPLLIRVGKFIGIVLEPALSWINVAFVMWRIVTLLLTVAREAFSSAPESIKQLRFPLKTNPDLAAESVWAYALALRIRVGEVPPDETSLAEELADLSSRLPRFDRNAALRQLEALEVVKPTVIAAAVEMARRSGGEGA